MVSCVTRLGNELWKGITTTVYIQVILQGGLGAINLDSPLTASTSI